MNGLASAPLYAASRRCFSADCEIMTMLDQDAQLEKFKRALKCVAMILPLLTVVGFFGVLAFLMPIFGQWGLSAAQLVSPADTIVPGLFIGYLVLAMIYLPFLLGEMVSWFSTGKRHGLVHAFLAVLFLIAGVWYFATPDPQWKLVAAFLAATCSARLILAARKWKWPSQAAKIVLAAPAVGLSVWLVDASTVLADQVAEVGLARGLHVSAQDAPCEGRVLWYGEKAIVIRCSVDPQTIRVMTPKDGLMFALAPKAPK